MADSRCWLQGSFLEGLCLLPSHHSLGDPSRPWHSFPRSKLDSDLVSLGSTSYQCQSSLQALVWWCSLEQRTERLETSRKRLPTHVAPTQTRHSAPGTEPQPGPSCVLHSTRQAWLLPATLFLQAKVHSVCSFHPVPCVI